MMTCLLQLKRARIALIIVKVHSMQGTEDLDVHFLTTTTAFQNHQYPKKNKSSRHYSLNPGIHCDFCPDFPA